MRILVLLIPDPIAALQRHLRLDRIAAPYYLFAEAGIEVVLASPEGGAPAVVTGSQGSDAVDRIMSDRAARDALTDTLAVSEVDPDDFEAVYCVGPLGAIWGVDADAASRMVGEFLTAGKPVAVLPGLADTTPNGSGAGLLIFGDDVGAPRNAANAVLGVLMRASSPTGGTAA